MAKYGNTLAKVQVYINGKEQAKKDLDELKLKAAGFKQELADTRKEITAHEKAYTEAQKRANEAAATKGTGSEEYSKAVYDMLESDKALNESKKREIQLKGEQKQIQKAIRETEKLAQDIAEDLDNLSGLSIKRLKELMRTVDAMRTSLKPESDPEGQFLSTLNEAFNDIVETIDNKKGKLVEFKDIMDDLPGTSDAKLAAVHKRLDELIRKSVEGSDEMKTYKAELQEVVAEEQKRIQLQAKRAQEQVKKGKFEGTTVEEYQQAIELQKQYQKQLDSTDAAGLKAVEETIEGLNKKMTEAQRNNAIDTLTKGLGDSSTGQIKQSVDFLVRYRETLKPLTPEWEKVNAAIEAGNAKLKSLTDQTRLQAMTNQFKQLGSLSASALSEQKKYWQEMVNGAASGSKELGVYETRLKKVIAEEQKRSKEKAGKVMTNLSDYSVTEIREAIKATEQLRDAQKPGSKAWAEYAAQVKVANDYLDSFKNKAQFEAMNTQFKNLGTLSADALAEQKKYWQAMVNGADNGSKELEKYRKKLAEVTAEEQKRSAASVKDVMKNPVKYSVNEIREAIRVTEQLRDAQAPDSKAWKDYAEQVENANKVMESFKDKAKIEGMVAQYRNLSSLSKSALAEQKKFWQAMADGAAKGSKELELYESRLKLVANEEKRRTREQGRDLASTVISGSWTGTVGEAKEAVKLLKEYKDTLSTTNTAGIRQVDKAIAELNSKTKLAEAGFRSTTKALDDLVRQTKNLGYGNFKGSIAELEEMRRKLLTLRDTQDKVLSARDRDRLTKAIQRVDKELGLAKGDLLDINYILANMKDTPLKTLERAAAQLQAEIRECSESTKDFTDKAAQLRRVNAQVDKLKKSFKEKENVIMRTAKRLAAYVAVYGGFNFIIGKVKELTQANLQLSDSYADIQKTTGLSSEQVRDLSKSIDSIDTRTTQQQLHELAAVAGQLGLKSQTDILGFVKASNMISVSLNELGSEGTSSLMKIATLTGEASEGTEQALLKIGSAINELTANSAATAGPIVDLMTRMGGVASQAGLTSAQMAAIGATADALGQSMEVTGTSMNKFVTTLMSSSDEIAYALNMDAKALRDLLDEGKTMDAMIAVFERMQKMGGMSELAGVMGDLGSEGARMTQVLTAMAKNVNFLKSQVELSTDAYKDATSIQNEYNIKNENALAIWQRIGNMLKELLVNSFFVDILTSISRGIHNVLDVVIQGEYFFKILASSIAAVTAALYANSAAWVQNLNAMGFKAGVEALWGRLIAVWDTLATTVTGGTKAVWGATKAAWAAAEGTNVFKKAVDLLKTGVKNLASFLSRNWLTAAIAAIAALAAWMVTAATRVSELTRATARYHREVEEEKNKVDALFSSLKRLNNSEEDRAKIISTINQQYGDYLGFMLSEKDSAEKLAAAHKLINSELEKRMALNLQSTLQGKASNVYAEEYEKASAGIGSIIKGEGLFDAEDLKGKINPSDVTSFVSGIINEIVSKAITSDSSGRYRELGKIDNKETLESIKKEMQKRFNHEDFDKDYAEGLGFGGAIFQRTSSQIEAMLEARIEYMEDVLEAEKTADLEMGRITRNAEEDRKAILAQTEVDIKALQETKVQDNWTEEQTQEHYANLLHQLRTYVEQSESIRKNMSEEEKKQYEKDMRAKENAYKAYYDKIAPLAGEDPWGKTLNVSDWKDFAEVVTNLDTSSAEALAAAYKKITEDTAKIPSNVKKFYKMFEGTGLETKLNLQNPTDVATQIHKWAEQIKEKLATKYGRNTSLGFIFESDGSGGKRPKDEYEAALASLEAYYNDRETIVRKNALLEETTQEELDKRLQSLEQEHLSARIELRKLMLSKDSEFLTTFNHVAESEYMQGIDYNKLQTQLGKFGKAMAQGLEKNLTEDMVTLQKLAWAHQEEISRILLENDPVQKVALEYQKSFEKIDLFWSADELRTKDAAREKMATLLEFSTKRADLSDEDMRQQLESSEQFGNVVKTMTAEEFQAFLVLLDQYAEAATNAKRQATQKAIKNLEFNFDNSDLGKQVTGQLKNLEEMEAQFGDLDSSGLVLEATSLKKHKEFVEQSIALEQMKWNAMIEAEKNGMNRSEVLQELMLERDKATYEARLEVMKLIMDMDANMFEESNSRIDQMQGWGAISEIDATERQRSLIYAELGLKQMRIDELIRIEEEGQNRMDVINNLRLAKQNALYKADRRLTELTMQEYQQRAQVAQEWGTAIGTGLGEMIAGTEDAGKDLVKNLATMAVQSIGQMAQMYVAKQLLLSQQNMSEAAAAMTTATTAAAEATAVGAAKTAEATAIAMATPDSVLTGGASGAAKAAVISGLIAAAVAASIAIINSLFPGAGKKADATSRKLSTGMLTYAEGNYPVLGNDGKVYDAKYEGSNLKTGIYGGGAHFGIFSEKQPEMIVDGKTTQKLILNYPYIYDAITTIAKNGRLVNAMPTFASGDYPAGMQRIAQVEAVDMAGGTTPDMERMSAALEQSNAVIAKLNQILVSGQISANVDPYANSKATKRAERFMKRRGID